ncbi:hypothetical protein TNCV_3186291 [Trichonephila clavipes]|nr:hypothetical protein TNCV_3186291 [Trichonephila clavipes]
MMGKRLACAKKYKSWIVKIWKKDWNNSSTPENQQKVVLQRPYSCRPKRTTTRTNPSNNRKNSFSEQLSKARGVATTVSMIRGPQATGSPTCVTLYSYTNRAPISKNGHEGIQIQSPCRARYASVQGANIYGQPKENTSNLS